MLIVNGKRKSKKNRILLEERNKLQDYTNYPFENPTKQNLNISFSASSPSTVAQENVATLQKGGKKKKKKRKYNPNNPPRADHATRR